MKTENVRLIQTEDAALQSMHRLFADFLRCILKKAFICDLGRDAAVCMGGVNLCIKYTNQKHLQLTNEKAIKFQLYQLITFVSYTVFSP